MSIQKGNTSGQPFAIQCPTPLTITVRISQIPCRAELNDFRPALILQATGNYTTLTGPSETSYLVCQIAPKTTVIRADYAGEINAGVESESAPSPTQGAGGAAGFFAMYMITDVVWHQQGINVNGVAEQLLELSYNADRDQRSKIVVSNLRRRRLIFTTHR
jgi:hypothetical protein